MERKEELLKIIEKSGENVALLTSMVDDVVFMEEQLSELRKKPFIRIDDKNPQRQQATPAARQYKNLMQQYVNLIKVLMAGIGDKDGSETSPLRLWAEQNLKAGGADA